MRAFGVCPRSVLWLIAATDFTNSVMSVKGKKVLHIDRNDHYGGYVDLPTPLRDHTADHVQ